MSKITIISGTVTHTVFPGQHGYHDTLTVTDSGLILPETIAGVASSYGDAGILVRPKLAGVSITNMGTISGGAGRVYGQSILVNGGIGVDLTGAGAVVDNSGLITGGIGGYLEIGGISAGGIGIDVSGIGSTILNTGEITGGNGIMTYFDGGDGGIGVVQSAAGTLTNDGTITGGHGGNAYADDKNTGGNGGVGVDLSGAGAIVINHGMISGGLGGNGYYSGRNANGADVTKGARFTNYGTVTGQSGVHASIGAVVVNDGFIAAVASTYPFAGVFLDFNGTLINNGDITGAVAYPPDYKTGSSSDGVDVGTGCSITNNGTITGGALGYAGASQGGVGVSVDAKASFVNTGLIVGGQSAGYQGSGGYGVVLSHVANASNSGTIKGGYGNNGVVVRNSVFANTGLL